MSSLASPDEVQKIVARISRVEQTTRRQWGTMTPHEMLCHLADSFHVALGERPASAAETWLNRYFIKWVALHTSMSWPKGVPTRPEVNPRELGSKPDVFEADRTVVINLIKRFVAPAAPRGRHPLWGELTQDEWLIWAFRHTDHHLRQFGL
jgi:hypothetical protein